MAGTFEGLGVPLFGEFYRYTSAQVETLYVEDNGVMNLTVANTTDTMDNAFNVSYSCSGTYASGYGHGVHVDMAVNGTSAGAFSSQQFNAFGADVTINGVHTCGIGGLYVYIAEGTATLDTAQVYGGYFDMTACGATDYFSCITLD